MAKEYIEREALLQEMQSRIAWSMSYDAIYAAIQEAPAADAVEVLRGKDSVLAEFENDYKDFKKIKTHLAQIIVEGKVEEPCYSILWWDEESKEYNIGYSSYCLDYVRKWLELVFEVVDTADVVEVVRCRDCKHRGTDECIFHIKGEPADEELLAKLDNDFCSYGERRDSDE